MKTKKNAKMINKKYNLYLQYGDTKQTIKPDLQNCLTITGIGLE